MPSSSRDKSNEVPTTSQLAPHCTAKKHAHFQHLIGRANISLFFSPFNREIGAANIGDAGQKQVTRLDKDLVPEAAVRPSQDNTDYHVGRGGAGNEHHVAKKTEEAGGANGAGTKCEGLVAPVGLADKLKYKLFGLFTKGN